MYVLGCIVDSRVPRARTERARRRARAGGSRLRSAPRPVGCRQLRLAGGRARRLREGRRDRRRLTPDQARDLWARRPAGRPDATRDGADRWLPAACSTPRARGGVAPAARRRASAPSASLSCASRCWANGCTSCCAPVRHGSRDSRSATAAASGRRSRSSARRRRTSCERSACSERAGTRARAAVHERRARGRGGTVAAGVRPPGTRTRPGIGRRRGLARDRARRTAAPDVLRRRGSGSALRAAAAPSSLSLIRAPRPAIGGDGGR